jgi:large-conductance mechanosensitive channel
MSFMSIMFSFMYFPEDKTEYIPAVINLIIFSIFAYLAMRFFMKISKREEKKAKELEEQLKITAQEKNS